MSENVCFLFAATMIQVYFSNLRLFELKLLQLNIRHVLSITTHEIESFNSQKIKQQQIFIEDGASTLLLEYLEQCWAFIDAALASGSAILVQDEVGMYDTLLFDIWTGKFNR
jgi:hypothetical protein